MFESRQSVGREAIQIFVIVTGNNNFKLGCVKGLLIYPCLGIELKSPYDLIIEPSSRMQEYGVRSTVETDPSR